MVTLEPNKNNKVMNIKGIINVHKFACKNIADLEETVGAIEIENDKDKANFGNLCIALKGFRMVAEATEAILINEDVLKGQNGEFYQKVDTQENTDAPAPEENGEGGQQQNAE